MSAKESTDQKIVAFLKEKGSGTVDDICEAVQISRTSARKYLAGLHADKKIRRESGGREGRRKLPDVFSPSGKRAGNAAKSSPRQSGNGRLGPNELNKLVLTYMRRHKKTSPHTPSRVAKAIGRSAGAVANCFGRMEKAKEVRLVKPKPREYELVETKRK